MYALHYKTESENIRILFAVLNDAFCAARALDELKAHGVVSNVFVSNADDENSMYLVPAEN